MTITHSASIPSKSDGHGVLPNLQPRWLHQLSNAGWRTPIFYEMVNAEIIRLDVGKPLTVLDIGCGRGFDGETDYQRLLAERSSKFLGVEPDTSIEPPGVFTQLFRTSFEQASIPSRSVDIAFAVMVMEHVIEPSLFWKRLSDVLVPGGVFLAFTVNGLHWFSKLTKVFNLLNVKGHYLNSVYGPRGSERYEDYPVYYRSNTKAQIARCATNFRYIEVVDVGKIGAAASYAPRILRPCVRAIDRSIYWAHRERINLIIRAVR